MERLVNFGGHQAEVEAATSVDELKKALNKFIDSHQNQTDDIINQFNATPETRKIAQIVVRKVGDVTVPIDPPMEDTNYKVDPTLLYVDPVTKNTIESESTAIYNKRQRTSCVVNCSTTGILHVALIPFK